jgi:hypothetical protein
LIPTGNEHVLCYLRIRKDEHAIMIANFSEAQQHVHYETISGRIKPDDKKIYGASQFNPGQDLVVEPLDILIIG